MLNQGRALWYALKVEDYDLVEFLINQKTDIRQTYEFEPKRYLSTASLLTLRVCQARSKGLSNLHYKRMYQILDNFLQYAEECDIRCHCSKNYEHRCPLYIALKALGVKKEEDMFNKKNDILKALLIKGANLRIFQGQTQIIDVEGYRQYLIQRIQFQKTSGFKQTQDGYATFSQ
ncbi:unnamed protein product (macronuclear) [Paramecium tetraurelia]|uniref:SWIM-type domain-containing protein n=1 Tax=Paramecium tetraurelia TaxID=5888 RepID=A0C496_PARTE|nr:uncharacterized protein GSPATT00035093001 [Paramecium tetraurelia]CAK65613.1 unnamed protein product [Paramecium tetraurelia]|eukprot:XP_001433010.1 hypothetical protein (macronuclear) [Paramecium tetraurelia strain d4-2]